MNKRSVKERRLLRERRVTAPSRYRYSRPMAKNRGDRAAVRQFSMMLSVLTRLGRVHQDSMAAWSAIIGSRYSEMVELLNARMHEENVLPVEIDLVMTPVGWSGPHPDAEIWDETQAELTDNSTKENQ